jgi:chemotaxis protein methyltransferase CheR
MSEPLERFTMRNDAHPWEAFAFTGEDFKKISAILHQDAGIWVPESKATLVYSRLTKRLRALGLESFRDYCALISSQKGGAEKQQMIAALTTNVRTFFREPHHFEDLRREVLRRRADEIRKGARLRIWSAACSSGQEPYSIAMTVLSVFPEAAQLDIRVLATDIDYSMIAKGKVGAYDEEAVASIPATLLDAYFTPSQIGGSRIWTAGEKLSSLIAFRELNLVGTWPMKGRFDAIFCRNVVIYFDQATQHQTWLRFLPLLAEGGRLYIGHSERVSGAATKRLIPDGVTTYRLGEERER